MTSLNFLGHYSSIPKATGKDVTKQANFWVNSVLRAVAALCEMVLQHWRGTKRAMLAVS